MGELEVVYVFFFFSVIKASLDSSSVISLPYVPMWLGIRACKIVFFSLEFMYFLLQFESSVVKCICGFVLGGGVFQRLFKSVA